MRDDGAAGPAYQQLAESLRGSILSGELGAGERLPSEAVLAARSGVSRSTVREALRVLQEAGLLERSSPRILVVRAHAHDPAVRAMTHALRRRTVTFAALYEALTLLEPELARLAALRCDDEDLNKLHEILEEQQRQWRDYTAWCRLDEAFHVAIAEASGNAPLLLARTALGQVLVPIVAQFVDSDLATHTAIDYHRRIFDELSAGDTELASLVARRHVEDFQAAWERSGLGYHRDISELINAVTARPL